MDPEEGRLSCGNVDCTIADTQKCVEGLIPEDCPHFRRTPMPTPHSPEAADPPPISPALTLPGADRLSLTAADKILRATHTRVIAIVGPTDAGKTSLIASLYDLFQQGPVGPDEFAGSTTLHAFERACHDARAASQRGEPHAERTARGGVGFYHLDLSTEPGPTLEALVLGDRAGEEYRNAADDVAVSAGFAEVLRADVLTVLVDGHRLLDTSARHNVRSEIEMIVQGLDDGDALLHRPRAAVVLTKLDEVLTSPHGNRAMADFESLVEAVRQHHADVFPEIQPFRIAASPKTADLPRGHGLDALLAFWRKSHPTVSEVPLLSLQPHRAIARLVVSE